MPMSMGCFPQAQPFRLFFFVGLVNHRYHPVDRIAAGFETAGGAPNASKKGGLTAAILAECMKLSRHQK